MNLKDATVIGFFSLPSVSLAEHNTTAYNLAMAAAPAGAGTCAHCGMGIRHHVVIRTAEGRQAFIGTTCAERVGDEHVRSCVRDKVTSEQKAAIEAQRAEHHAQWQAAQDAAKAAKRARCETLRDILEFLLACNSEFHRSLAEQLANGPLSSRQAYYVAKAMVGPRQNKRNIDAWEAIEERCTAEKDVVAS